MAPGGLQQDGHLLRQQVVVPPVLLPGWKLGQVEQTVFLVVEGRKRDRLCHSPIRQQARFLLEAAEICPHGQGAGGEDHGPVLAPQGAAELGGQVGNGGAKHGAAPLVLRRVENHVGPAAVEHCCGGEHPGQDFPGGRGKQTVELPTYHGHSSLRAGEQAGKLVEGPVLDERQSHLLEQRPGHIRQRFRPQQVFFLPQAADQGLNVAGFQGGAEHLPGRFGQLVGLVDDNSAAVGQNGPAACAPMDRVGQEQIVVADLESELRRAAVI